MLGISDYDMDFHRRWSSLLSFLWVVSIVYAPVAFSSLNGVRVIQPIWMLGQFRIHLISYGELELWYHLTIETAIKLSFSGAIFPLILAIVSIIVVSRNLTASQASVLTSTAVVLTILMGRLGVIVRAGDMTWLGPGPITMFLALLLQCLNSWILREKSPVIASIAIYASLFVGLFFGDLLQAYYFDGFRSVVTGGAMLSDGLVWVPSFFTLIFRFIHPIDEFFRSNLVHQKERL